ncbi:NUDIX domain-containing protein [Frankia sp. R82]|uniref:NUDIX domain-containing protein n=1 Tax=Frankia sp. R82 TaxID=2950553 RepID=UPI002042FF5D|nr:NUDIX domain-containing protein [Frankia sp. R82]MCM3883660.1 NUDIX domain-containing protein [Frankia sp. R82]
MTDPARPFAPTQTAATQVGKGAAADRRRPAGTPPRINVRALLVEGGRIMLTNVRGQSTFHLPGGPVEAGETIQAALRRQLDKQADIEASHVTFVGCVEGTRIERGTRVAELDVIFSVDRSWAAEFGSRLDDLDVVSTPLSSLGDLQLQPEALRSLIPDWLQHGRPLWQGATTAR